MARRFFQATAGFGAVVLAGLLWAVLLGAPAARAGSLQQQVFGPTTAVPDPGTSVVPPTSPVPQTTARTATTATTAPRAPATTAPAPRSRTPVVTAPRAVTPGAGYTPPTYYTQPPTTPAPATTTTIVPLGNSLPVSPVTLPLLTKGSNAHVNPVYAILSGIGFLVALVIVAGRLFVTRTGGSDRRPVPPDERDVGPSRMAPGGLP